MDLDLTLFERLGTLIFSHKLDKTTFRLGVFYTFNNVQFFAAPADDKKVYIFSTAAGNSQWALKATATFKKKISCCSFGVTSNKTLELLCGDKFGDVYSVDNVIQYVGNASAQEVKNLVLRMGHVSSLTDMVCACLNQYCRCANFLP